MVPAHLPPATEAQVRAIGTADPPRHLGRCASFVVEMQGAGPDEVEARVEPLALVFEALKPLLVAEWPTADKEASS